MIQDGRRGVEDSERGQLSLGGFLAINGRIDGPKGGRRSEGKMKNFCSLLFVFVFKVEKITPLCTLTGTI